MRLTTRSRYGTRMVLDIAINATSGPVHISDISERQGISKKYLEKLARKLKEAGIITSLRGPYGGHQLKRPPEEITVGDIVRILEEMTAVTECAEGDRVCGVCNHAGECMTQGIWIETSRVMFDKLDSYTIASMMPRTDRS